MEKPEKAKKILDVLEGEFPDAATALEFSNPLELLISTILSAQATDKLVNKVAKDLFKKYRTAEDYASTPLDELEEDLSSVNFYRNKAKSVKNCTTKLVEDFGGEVPGNLDDMVKLPGVGRKTANVVLGNAFNLPALAVDTHVKRVAGRLGLTDQTDPDKIEADLTSFIPEDRWTLTTHVLILHGRKTCKSRKPLCEECPVSRWCDYYKEVVKGRGG